MKKNIWFIICLFILSLNGFCQTTKFLNKVNTESSVNSVLFSPDGTLFASASSDEITLWDVSTMKKIRQLKGHRNTINAITYSPNGLFIASASSDKTIKLWDVNSGKEVREFLGHTDAVNSIAFSPNGTNIVSGGQDRAIILWDAETGMKIHKFTGHTDWIFSTVFSPDGKYIASSSMDKSIKIWSIETKNEIKSLVGHSSVILSLSFSKDGKFLYSGSGDNSIKSWDISNENLSNWNNVHSFVGHSNWVKSISVNSQNTILASGSWDNLIKLWDIASGKEICSLNNHTGNLLTLAFSSDDNLLISGGSDNTIILWNISGFNEDVSIKKNTKLGKHQPPILITSDIKFSDSNNNNKIDANEECKISFTIKNQGKGIASDVVAKISNTSLVKGLVITKNYNIGQIPVNNSKFVSIPITGSMDLTTGLASISIKFEENAGFPPDDIQFNLETKEYQKPFIKVVDFNFKTENNIIKLGYPIQLKCLIQNVGQGKAENVNVNFNIPDNIFATGESQFLIGDLEPGKYKNLLFEFVPNKLFKGTSIPIAVVLKEKYNKFSQNETCVAKIDEKTTTTNISLASVNENETNIHEIQVASLSSDVDKNIPINKTKMNRFALVIGNEDYKSKQPTLSTESNVEFAISDAKIFKDYLINTFGLDEKNIKLIVNATTGEFKQNLDWLSKLAKKYGNDAEIYFYYAGHGLPEESTKEPYIIPVDVNAANLSSAIKLTEIYNSFSQTNASKITVFLDACFSGGARGSNLIAARGVKIKPKNEILNGNIVVFTASSGEQSALPYKEKGHGMFTYFLLKKIQESKGNITYKDLQEYISKQVSFESSRTNSKDQDPQLLFGQETKDKWEKWEIK